MTVIEQMELCRKICSLGHKLRNLQNIPTRIPLKELQFKGVFLSKDYWKLIKEEVNVENVNPFFFQEEFIHLVLNTWWKKVLWKTPLRHYLRTKNSVLLGEKWEGIQDGALEVRLNLFLDDYQVVQGQEAKERREKIMANKQSELVMG